MLTKFNQDAVRFVDYLLAFTHHVVDHRSPPALCTPGEMLTEGRCAVRRFTEGELRGTNLEERVWRHPQWIPAGYVLDDADQFDAALFGIAANEAGTTGTMSSASRTARV